MKKLGCAKCGGTKMSKGGSTEIVGMPKYGNNPRTQTGAMLKKGGMVKAKFGASVPVQRSPKPGRVRASSGVGTVPIGKRKIGGPVVKKKVLNKAQYGQSIGPITETQSKFNNTAKASMGSLGQPPVPYANRPNAYESYNTQLDNDKRMQSENNQISPRTTKSGNLYKQKKGGATKATKLAAVAPPKNKVTRADVLTRILKKKKK